MSREQFELIRPLLEGFRKRTKPRTVDLYEVFCGVFSPLFDQYFKARCRSCNMLVKKDLRRTDGVSFIF